MGLHSEIDPDESSNFSDYPLDEEDSEAIMHKKRIKKLLEQRLERKRLKEEIDELDGEFDWDEVD